jgi:hypothetical protein
MNCDDVRELEAAFALGALDADEFEAVREHLGTCDKHADFVELRAAAIALGTNADELAPPAALRERVVASASATNRSPGRSRKVVVWPLAAAAVVVLLLGAGAGLGLLRGDDDRYVREFTTDVGISVRLQTRIAEPGATVAFAGLEKPPEGEGYVLWAIRGGDWIRMGRFEPNEDGTWEGKFAFSLHGDDAICLTMTGTEDAANPFGVPLFIEPVAS